jgi:hypothetical protein
MTKIPAKNAVSTPTIILTLSSSDRAPKTPSRASSGTTADSNDIAPLARSVPVAGNLGFVGSTAAWQPASTESLYPATESARPRPREGTKFALSAPRLSFWEGQVSLVD